MSPAIRHAYGYTLIGIAMVLYVWHIFRLRSLQQQIKERFPELGAERKRTMWRSWGSRLPQDPAIRRYAHMTQVMDYAAMICFFAGISLAETSWNIFW